MFTYIISIITSIVLVTLGFAGMFLYAGISAAIFAIVGQFILKFLNAIKKDEE